MYVLTEKRFTIVEPILAKYRDFLRVSGTFDSTSLERDMREALGIGVREFKDIIRHIVKKHAKYKRVAAYYMQYSNAIGPTSAFKGMLARLYGVPSYNDRKRPAKQQRYWARK
jgi:hypothetical protein